MDAGLGADIEQALGDGIGTELRMAFTNSWPKPEEMEAAMKSMPSCTVQEALGKHTYEKFIEAKLSEFDDYRMQITPWEIEKYLEAL